MTTRDMTRRWAETSTGPKDSVLDGDTGKIIPVSSVSLHEGEKEDKSEEFRRGKSSPHPGTTRFETGPLDQQNCERQTNT